MAATTTQLSSRQSPLLQHQLRLLNPTLRAYILGLLSTTSPKLISVIISTIIGKTRPRDAAAKLQSLFKHQTQLDKFPAICAILVGGATLFPIPLLALLDKYQSSTRKLSPRSLERAILVTKLLCAAVAAQISFDLLNRRDSKPVSVRSQSSRRQSDVTFNPQGALHRDPPPPPFKLAGRTLDLTLFGVVRATDIAISSIWSAYRRRPQQKTGSGRTANISEMYVSPAIFAFSCCIIMWSWFHTPDRLPRSYNQWISSAAQIDPRLVEALRQCHYGPFEYGADTGWAPLLTPLCRELGYPEVWADPSKTVPIPCELYHSGTGKSCEWHAISRFARAFKFSMQMYLPLNLLMLLRRKPGGRSILQAFKGASQSSAFLAAFVTFFYYGVCLTRTRIGPKILPRKYFGPQQIDGGLCVGTGCFACGWSILIENPARRNEIAFFVAPRALATVFPRRYNKQYLWTERIAFVASAAIIMTAAQVQPARVRGVFGRLLDQVFV